MEHHKAYHRQTPHMKELFHEIIVKIARVRITTAYNERKECTHLEKLIVNDLHGRMSSYEIRLVMLFARLAVIAQVQLRYVHFKQK